MSVIPVAIHFGWLQCSVVVELCVSTADVVVFSNDIRTCSVFFSIKLVHSAHSQTNVLYIL